MRRRANVVLATLVIAHVGFSFARTPHSAVLQRIEDIDEHRGRGAVRYHLDNKYRRGATAVQWILDNVPEDGVVPFRGTLKGSLEFVPALVWPRLLVALDAIDPGETRFVGRPIASGVLPDGSTGRIVLVGRGDDLTLEVR